MQTKSKTPVGKGKRTQNRSQPQLLWWGVGLAIILFGAIAFWVSRDSTIPFEMTGGDITPVVLLREEGTVYYDFEYTGNAPAVLERIIPRIQLYQDQVLVVDVQGVSVVYNGEEVRLEEGYFPSGDGLELQPNDTFQLGITYLGQELGWNRIFGFRLQYSLEGTSIDGELELIDNYLVYVE